MDFKPVMRGFDGFTVADCGPVPDMVTLVRRLWQVLRLEIAYRIDVHTNRGAPVVPRAFRVRELCLLRGRQSSPRVEWSKAGGRWRTRFAPSSGCSMRLAPAFRIRNRVRRWLHRESRSERLSEERAR